MPLVKRKDIETLIAKTDNDTVLPVYLIIGERFLCRNAADELISRVLTPTEQTNRLHPIDGDQEDFNRTLHLLRTYSLFPGLHVVRVTDSRLFLSKGVARAVWDKAAKAMASGDLRRAGRSLARMLALGGLSPNDPDDQEIAALPPARWKKLFGFAKPEDNLGWTKEALQQTDGADSSDIPADAANDPGALFQQAFEKGLPASNILIMTAETVDKRKRFFKYIEKQGAVLDLSVDTGASTAARKDQDVVLKGLVRKALVGHGKTMEPKALQVLLERVGFHPVAVVTETEKLCLYVGDAPSITLADLDAVLGRTREDALYEFVEAFSSRRLETALLISERLRENGTHGLAMVAALRNHLNKLLLARSLQSLAAPAYSIAMPFKRFQQEYLPALKTGREEWSAILWKSHPYSLFMLFRQASKFKLPMLKAGLQDLLATEFRCKGSPIPPGLILDSFLFKQLLPGRRDET